MEIVHMFVLTLIIIGTINADVDDAHSQNESQQGSKENDFVSIKKDIKELRVSIDQLEKHCNTNDEVSSDIYKKLMQDLSDEKAFVRDSLKNMTEKVSKTRKMFWRKLSKLKRLITGIDDRCSRTENDVLELQKNQSDILEKVDLVKNDLEKEMDDLLLHVNQSLEKTNKVASNKPGSCIDIFKAGITTSGVYTLYYKMEPFTVYCLMSQDGGYTFISPETYLNVDIEALSNDKSHVIIRHRRTNGLQYESHIKQIDRYKSRPLSVQYNSNVGYKDVINKNMGPFIYVGLNPIKLEGGRSHLRDTQGYKSNGQEFTFINCDGNPNGYFAFLFNHNKGAVSTKGESPQISRKWIDSSTKVTTDILPDKFMSFFELHFGGCGAFAGTNHINYVTGAAVGIPYKLS